MMQPKAVPQDNIRILNGTVRLHPSFEPVTAIRLVDELAGREPLCRIVGGDPKLMLNEPTASP